MNTQTSAAAGVYPNGATEEVNNIALFSQDPEQAFLEAQKIVNVVSRRCTGPGYLVNIKGKNYPTISWWTTVGASLGLFPQVVYARRIDRDDEIVYESRVEIKKYGQIIASAESICSSKEERWVTADEHAIMSMSSTRAAGKCFRLALSFIAVLADLESTPAEEMTTEATPNPQCSKAHDGADAPTDRQMEAVYALLDHPKVYPREKRTLSELLQNGKATKSKCSEILGYFYGVKVRNPDGFWTKSGKGQLDLRS